MNACLRLAVLATAGALLSFAAPDASAQASYYECSGCSTTQIRDDLSIGPNGVRYVFDLDARTMRQFNVSRNSWWQEVATVTEAPVWQPAYQALVPLFDVYAADPLNFFSVTEYNLPIRDMGANPNTGYPYRPADIAWDNGGFNGWTDRLISYLNSPLALQNHPNLAGFIQSIGQLQSITGGANLGGSTQGATLSLGAQVTYQYRAKSFRVKLTADDGTYVLLSIDETGALTYLGAFDGTQQLPDHNIPMPGVYGGAGAVSWDFGSNGSGARDWVDMLRARGVPISNGNGWRYVSCSFVNGRLISCTRT